MTCGAGRGGAGLALSCDVLAEPRAFLSGLSFPASQRDSGGLWFWTRKHCVSVQRMVVIWFPNAPLGVKGHPLHQAWGRLQS